MLSLCFLLFLFTFCLETALLLFLVAVQTN
jgi:hypothetical protein